jgi:nucleotide-binding universal stress UspA family protein
MQILIGYDGSDCAKAAIADLQWAGLPDRIEAEVLSVADVFPHLTPECYRAPAPGEPEDSPIIKRARALALQALAEAKELSEEGAADVRARFSGWEVRANAVGHSPYWGIISRADQWGPDLVVVGSHGRSAAGRVLLGSPAARCGSEGPGRCARWARCDCWWGWMVHRGRPMR